MRKVAIGAIFLALFGHAQISSAATHFVVTNNPDAADPYTTIQTAGTSIIDVVKAALTNTAPRFVLISPGEYWLTNTVVLTNDITVCGTNGRDNTIINGVGGTRFFNVSSGAGVIAGLTLRNGGGVLMESATGLLTNCVVASNYYAGSVPAGAGVRLTAAGCVADCVIVSNLSKYSGRRGSERWSAGNQFADRLE